MWNVVAFAIVIVCITIVIFLVYTMKNKRALIDKTNNIILGDEMLQKKEEE